MSVANIDNVLNKYEALEVPGLRLQVYYMEEEKRNVVWLANPTPEILEIVSKNISQIRYDKNVNLFLGEVQAFEDAFDAVSPKLIQYKLAQESNLVQETVSK